MNFSQKLPFITGLAITGINGYLCLHPNKSLSSQHQILQV